MAGAGAGAEAVAGAAAGAKIMDKCGAEKEPEPKINYFLLRNTSWKAQFYDEIQLF